MTAATIYLRSLAWAVGLGALGAANGVVWALWFYADPLTPAVLGFSVAAVLGVLGERK